MNQFPAKCQKMSYNDFKFSGRCYAFSQLYQQLVSRYLNWKERGLANLEQLKLYHYFLVLDLHLHFPTVVALHQLLH